MLDGAIAELNEKGFTEANEANAQGTRPSDGEESLFHNHHTTFQVNNCENEAYFTALLA